jgi:hypothetical protein
LEDNDLELFEVSIIGSNMNKHLSVVRLTDLARLTSTTTVYKSKIEQETDNLQPLLQDQNLSNQKLFEYLYPEIATATETEINDLFDLVPIDMKSLSNYIAWLKNDAIHFDKRKKDQFLIQADTILRIAQYTNGTYFQRKKESSFGRNYYSGISAQNVNKELRRAMLGHCWEYDIRSSVFAWKMGHARECYETLKTEDTFEKFFAQTLIFLEDKKDFSSVRLKSEQIQLVSVGCTVDCVAFEPQGA